MSRACSGPGFQRLKRGDTFGESTQGRRSPVRPLGGRLSALIQMLTCGIVRLVMSAWSCPLFTYQVRDS